MCVYVCVCVHAYVCVRERDVIKLFQLKFKSRLNFTLVVNYTIDLSDYQMQVTIDKSVFWLLCLDFLLVFCICADQKVCPIFVCQKVKMSKSAHQNCTSLIYGESRYLLSCIPELHCCYFLLLLCGKLILFSTVGYK